MASTGARPAWRGAWGQRSVRRRWAARFETRRNAAAAVTVGSGTSSRVLWLARRTTGEARILVVAELRHPGRSAKRGSRTTLGPGIRPHVDQVLVMAAPSFAPDGTFSIWLTCATVGFALARSWAEIRRLCGRVRRAVGLRRLSTSREAGVLREYRFARRAIPRGRCCARSVAVLGLPV